MENRRSFVFESLEQEESYREQYLLQERDRLFASLKKESSPEANKIIVASKGGSKYYFVWCKGAENIKEANKRYFTSEDNAKKAGYSIAASCK